MFLLNVASHLELCVAINFHQQYDFLINQLSYIIFFGVHDNDLCSLGKM